MEHYRALGVGHCVFLDNGSTDDTVDRLCAYGDVTVLQTDAPYEKFENTMKRYLADGSRGEVEPLCGHRRAVRLPVLA